MGFAVPVSGSWATPRNVVEVAERADQLGYRSIWTFQRLLYPADDSGGGWAPAYRSVLDPLVVLGHVAAVTTRVRLGVAIVNAPFFSPALLAKQFTTIDILSGGRLDAGIGIGWSAEEYAASGIPEERRGARLEEFLDVLQKLWTQDVVDHEGEFYRVPPSRQDPKPMQRPHPPLYLGAFATTALQRAGRIADGWISGSTFALDRMHLSVRTVRDAAEQAGRDPSSVRIVCRGSVRLRPEPEPDKPYSGPIDVLRQRLGELEEIGVDEFFVDLNFDPQIGNPDADPEASMDTARELLEALAPKG